MTSNSRKSYSRFVRNVSSCPHTFWCGSDATHAWRRASLVNVIENR
jgi:hypothetical protein